MGIIRESLAKANANAKKVVNVKKEEKVPIVFNQGDDSVEPVDEGEQGVAAGSVAQITGENFSKLMEAFITAGKFGRDGKIAHVVGDALAEINEDNCTPEAVIEALRAAGLGFIADAFGRVCNNEDIDTIVSETVVYVDDEDKDDEDTGDGAPAGGDSSEEPAPEETPAEEIPDAAPANEEAPAESQEPAEKRKPGRPKNSDKK
jgi:hypothetical protein